MIQDSVKRRREERLKQLRKQMTKNDYSSREDGYMKDDVGSYNGFAKKREAVWEDTETILNGSSLTSGVSPGFLIKSMIALFIVSAVYLVYHMNLPYTDRAKGFVQEVMSKDFNFRGLAIRAERILGRQLTILPSFSEHQWEDHPVWNESSKPNQFSAPVEGQVVVSFALDGKGIEISAAKGSEVKAIEEGLVIFSGQKREWGQTVMIQHKHRAVSLYGHLGEVNVVLNDWVQPGQVIGTVNKETMYFSLQKENQFIDPLSVIRFE